jgi:hypothetical protein
MNPQFEFLFLFVAITWTGTQMPHSTFQKLFEGKSQIELPENERLMKNLLQARFDSPLS